jgi:hypothetical protein
VKFNTHDQVLDSELGKIFAGYRGELPVVARCAATGEVVHFPQKVRECQAIKFELEQLLGPDNFLFK